MKKVLVGMFALVACAGMAMAAGNTRTTTNRCKGFNKTCTNTVKSAGAYCSDCAAAKKETETALNYYKNKQEETCTTDNYTNGSVTPKEWADLNCNDYLNNKK